MSNNVVSFEKPRIDELERRVSMLEENLAQLAVVQTEHLQHYTKFLATLAEVQKTDATVREELGLVLKELTQLLDNNQN